MKPKVPPNWRRGQSYFYAPKATLAVIFIGRAIAKGIGIDMVPLYLKVPPSANPEDFHRVSIEVIRTKAEAKVLNAEWAKRRENFRVMLAERVAKGKA